MNHHHHSHVSSPAGGNACSRANTAAAPSANRAFAIGLALNIAFIAVETVAGFAADSLALLADAGHNLSDVLSLALAWAALWASRRPPRRRWTYGFGRASIIASLLNAALLLIAVGAIVLEAVQRFADPQPIAEGVVIAVAAVGVLINGASAALFMAGRKADLNIRAAFVHMAADAGVSLGVVAAALVIGWTGWLWLDPALGLTIAVVITVGTWGLLSESVRLALDAVPADIDRDGVERYLAALPGVVAVHDLHIWPLSTTTVALTAHLIRPDATADDRFLHAIADHLDERFGIAHATLQLERGDGDDACRLAGSDSV